ncbi:zinc finger protein CONSTANS-LIKE 2-like [Salvia miltiorrhiza]|uniref:zinc finger protein CONSTANS-LIKE 2-like n=1 Tax=Salvia miltiorrhiza TaxID=226208 RepID=UPI0025AD7033|nr:zinc finger protein CONSTANS-LIKE 2-like [Salvia miltiorrhiza]
MRRCELCKAKARMYCASDRASLCWDCDAAVHSANFLVARHSRNLLCDVCQSPTPWSASGGKLGPTVSVCEQCAGQEMCEDSGGGESESEEEELAEEEENQVVPWSPPPPAESYSSDDEAVDGQDVVVSRKLLRIEADRSCASSRLNIGAPPPYAAAVATSRSKTAPLHMTDSGRANACGSGILDSLRRLHREETGSGQEMAEFYDYSGPSDLNF